MAAQHTVRQPLAAISSPKGDFTIFLGMHQQQAQHTSRNKKPSKFTYKDYADEGPAENYMHHQYSTNAGIIRGTKTDGTQSDIPIGYRFISLEDPMTQTEIRMAIEQWNRELNPEIKDVNIPPSWHSKCGCTTRPNHDSKKCPCGLHKHSLSTNFHRLCMCVKTPNGTNKKR